MVEVSLIIPQHGHFEMTLELVSQIRRLEDSSLEIVVVDDGSPQPIPRELRSLRGISLFQQSYCGVTAAWNLGAKSASGEIFIFLNNDVCVEGAFVARLIAPLSRQTSIMTGANSRTEPFSRRLAPAWVPDEILEGWCMAVRREDFQVISGFDERFRMYYSDTDLQWRISALRSQAELVAVSSLPLRHIGHASTRDHPDRSRLHTSDRQQFLEKWIT